MTTGRHLPSEEFMVSPSRVLTSDHKVHKAGRDLPPVPRLLLACQALYQGPFTSTHSTPKDRKLTPGNCRASDVWFMMPISSSPHCELPFPSP